MTCTKRCPIRASVVTGLVLSVGAGAGAPETVPRKDLDVVLQNALRFVHSQQNEQGRFGAAQDGRGGEGSGDGGGGSLAAAADEIAAGGKIGMFHGMVVYAGVPGDGGEG